MRARPSRALTIAVAERYVQGVSTRKVTAIGIGPDGKRSIVGCSVQLSEAETHWQRCQFHLMQNAMAHVPKVAMRAEVAGDLRRVFDADEPSEAQGRLRTTNGLLRLASAVLSEISDDWETERAYLTMKAR